MTGCVILDFSDELYRNGNLFHFDFSLHSFYPMNTRLIFQRSCWRISAVAASVMCGLVGSVAAADTDSDGMDDAWETQHFGTIAALPDADADGDGLSNLLKPYTVSITKGLDLSPDPLPPCPDGVEPDACLKVGINVGQVNGECSWCVEGGLSCDVNWQLFPQLNVYIGGSISIKSVTVQ